MFPTFSARPTAMVARHIPFTFAAIFLSLWPSFAGAQDRSPVEPKSLPLPDQKVEPTKPAVEKIDGDRYRIGKITIDKKTREIRFPAKVNMTEGLLEFLVVHENGKVHESLLATDISPTQLNLAFTLLSYQASQELYPLPNGTGGVSDKFPDVPQEVRDSARIRIDFEWSEDGKSRKASANEWIQHAVKTSETMPSGPWVYGGSGFQDGKFNAEVTGDIIAIFLSQAAMINYPGSDNQDDEVWVPFPKRVPENGTNVTVIITPFSQSAKTPKS
jgi:hypothetical protein